MLLTGVMAAQANVNIAPSPLTVTPYVTPNILLILDNSNTMVEDVAGAVAAECDPGPMANCVAGAASPLSKSEIIRGVGRRLLDDYRGQINLGLMAYQQYPASATSTWTDNVILADIVDRIYDVSYSSSNYDPAFSGNPWDSARKRFAIPNPLDTRNSIYFNIRVPGYTTGSGQLNYYTTRESNSNWRNEPFSFNCYRTKTGTSDSLTTGYSSGCGTTSGNLNDSARARGVTHWGQRMVALPFNRKEWVSTNSPGLGYLHTPIALLDEAHRARIAKKIAPQHHRFSSGLLTNPNEPIIAAGLTPLEGTLYTARDYFLNQNTYFTTAQGRGNAQYPLPESCDVNTAIWLTDGMPSVTRTGVPLGADVSKALADAVTATRSLHEAAGVDVYVVGFAMPPTVSEDQLEQLAQAGGTRRAYLADDEDSLDEAMTRIFDNIIASPRESATSAVINTTRLESGTRLYSAGYRSEDWSGRLEAYTLDASGNRNVLWNAEEVLRQQQGRAIYTAAGPLRADNTALSAAQVDWLKGRDGNLRSRTTSNGTRRLLGDVVNANPVLMRATENTRDVLFVAANDGMLHAFDGDNGRELFAFLPSELVMGQAPITEVMQVDYSHRYFMDGTPAVRNIGTDGAPRQILVGTMGAGGRSVFALDVTSPASFTSSQVLWEFTHAELGLGATEPAIVKLADGTWAAVFGNGYNSASRRASLFVVDLHSGTLIRRIDVGNPGGNASNGLAPPMVTQWPDFDGTSRFAYAGDLLGNMWRFDINSGDVKRLLSGDAARPITSAPALATASGNRSTLVVLFGTGSYFQVGDAATLDRQRLYGLHDSVGASQGSGSLRQQRIVQDIVSTVDNAEGDSTRYRLRVTSNETLGNRQGWFLELPPGERVISTPALTLGYGRNRVRFSTLIPLNDPCRGGSEGYLLDLRIDDGGSGNQAIFDLNQDGVVDADDMIDGAVVSGIKFGTGEQVATVRDAATGLDVLYVGDPEGAALSRIEALSGNSRDGRQSWRQLR
ncbi:MULTISPECIES: pilus assembly protein [Halomonadaceae]|uniref:pilus assembly protein n=1 Tax=Halomonadaceae TaxID=28256 RepID=UPI00159948BA|nr:MULTISPECIES: PilC/PilY family type IV pilus protein [Halomonas]QJQ94281.1 hypothetical protein HIO72_02595 [Halomonas sp. PA5]